jgi:hypothetical protein
MESESETTIIPTTHRKLKLQNGLKTHKDYKKKINLGKLATELKNEKQYQINYDLDTNPRQNYIQTKIIGSQKIQGQFWLYSNGTITTNIGLSDKTLIRFFDAFYYIYVRDNLETI